MTRVSLLALTMIFITSVLFSADPPPKEAPKAEAAKSAPPKKEAPRKETAEAAQPVQEERTVEYSEVLEYLCGCWRGTGQFGSSTSKFQSSIGWHLNKKFVMENGTFVFGDSNPQNYTSLFVWDSKDKTIKFWGVNAGGSFYANVFYEFRRNGDFFTLSGRTRSGKITLNAVDQDRFVMVFDNNSGSDGMLTYVRK